MKPMKKYILSLLALWATVGVWAGNTITISTTEGAPDEEVTVSIGLENSDAVSSLQVSIPLDENLTLVSGSGQLGSRCTGHSLTVGVKDGVLNILVYSLSMTAITGNSGTVVSFRLLLGNQPQTVSLTPSKCVLTSSSGQPLNSTTESGIVTIRCAKAQYSTMEVDFGAVPIRSTYTEMVTVTNVGNDDLTVKSLMFSDVNVFSTTTTTPFTITPGDSKIVNITFSPVERGSISRTLKVDCNSVSKLNTIKLLAQPFAVNELHIQDASGISDEEVTVSMTMNNMDAISGYQVEFNMPEQFGYVANSFALSSRKQDHVGVATLNGNTLRIIVYSPTDKAFAGSDGEIGSFKVKLLGRYGAMLTPTNTVLSATINNKVENVVSAVYGGQISILSPQIGCDNTLDFGAVSVTEDCERSFIINNSGSAPLTISRITFDNGNMSIKEALPLVIAPWESQTVDVVYGSVVQEPFEATMNIYSNDPEQRMKTVTVSGSRFAPNYLSVNIPTVVPNGNLKVNVSIDNYDPITGIQFDMEYPGQYFESFENNVRLTTRAIGMTVVSHVVGNNTLRFFCYFMTGNSITAGSGKVMTILMKQKEGSVPVGDYNLTVKNIKLATAELNNKYAGTDTISCDFEVGTDSSDDTNGDVNNDGQVDTQDAILIIQHYLGGSPTGFDERVADMNNDGHIDTQDAILVIKEYLGIE